MISSLALLHAIPAILAYGLVFLLLLILVLILWQIGKDKLDLSSKIAVIICVVFTFIIIYEGIVAGNFHIPSLISIIVECVFIVGVVVAFIGVYGSYKKITSKEHQTESDIRKRQGLKLLTSHLIALFMAAIPFILERWGLLYKVFPDMSYGGDQNVIPFVNASMRVTFFLTMFIFLTDNILQRLASDIYTYGDVKDLDKFCLYLRSFSVDQNKEEKLICKMTRNLYPVYAIGDPNKIIQPNGAERIYVTDDIWQEVVKDLSSRCKLILLRLGQTDGALWEITNIFNANLIKKVIFIAYNQEDYISFSKMVLERFNYEMPVLSFDQCVPVGFYFIENNNTFEIKHYGIRKFIDVETMLNSYLQTADDLDREYTDDLELRNHNIRYMFDKTRIPVQVRKSLNWGIISPLVNMRHWSFFVWGLFLLCAVLSVSLHTLIPIFVFCLLAFLFGNRIEWAAGGWGSPELFIRHQKREAKLMWLSTFLGFVYSMIYILLS